MNEEDFHSRLRRFGNVKDGDMKRLLGLRDFAPMRDEVRDALLGSAERLLAWQRIDTTTNPRVPMRDMKKGVVLEVLEKALLPEALLKRPMAYIGSGIDIEYPLALGGRDIRMIDPVFADPQAALDAAKRIGSLVDKKVEAGATMRFDFDFGNGPEPVVVTLVSQPYGNGGYQLPEGTGSVILFASQNAATRVLPDARMRAAMSGGGVILHEADAIMRDEAGNEKTVQLGTL